MPDPVSSPWQTFPTGNSRPRQGCKIICGAVICSGSALCCVASRRWPSLQGLVPSLLLALLAQMHIRSNLKRCFQAGIVGDVSSHSTKPKDEVMHAAQFQAYHHSTWQYPCPCIIGILIVNKPEWIVVAPDPKILHLQIMVEQIVATNIV